MRPAIIQDVWYRFDVRLVVNTFCWLDARKCDHNESGYPESSEVEAKAERERSSISSKFQYLGIYLPCARELEPFDP